jgi:hypothetical protein
MLPVLDLLAGMWEITSRVTPARRLPGCLAGRAGQPSWLICRMTSCATAHPRRPRRRRRAEKTLTTKPAAPVSEQSSLGMTPPQSAAG